MSLGALLATTTSASDALALLGRARVGSNYEWLRQQITDQNIDVAHWVNKGSPVRHVVLADLKDDSRLTTANVKRYVIRQGLVDYSCAWCGLTDEWNGRPLILRLDHINGKRTDHRLSNLRFLCPNCDSQSDTYCGRNKKVGSKGDKTAYGRASKVKTKACACGTKITDAATQCRSCSRRNPALHPTKIDWPPVDEVLAEVARTSFAATGRKFGVSDNAVRDYIRSRAREVEGTAL